MRMHRIALVLSVLLSTLTQAADAVDEASQTPNRTLANHVFFYPLLQRTAFIQTQFGYVQGIGRYRATLGTPRFPDLGELRLFNVQERAELSVQVLPILLVEVQAVGYGRAAENGRSFLLLNGEPERVQGPRDEITLSSAPRVWSGALVFRYFW